MSNKKAAIQTGKLFKQTVPKMSDGFYSGDKPNPNLRAFVEKHLKEEPYDRVKDDYDVPAFDVPFEATKAKVLYELHSYHQGKKPHDPIIKYIEHYTKPDDLVLDPFAGSGGACLAAVLSGRKAIGIDRSPAATFIASNYCSPVDVDALTKSFESVMGAAEQAVSWMYRTKAGSGAPAEIIYQLWSQQFECPRCLENIAVFDAPTEKITGSSGKPVERLICPHCKRRNVIEAIDKTPVRKGVIPVATSYDCPSETPRRCFRTHSDPNAKEAAAFLNSDLSLIADADAFESPYTYPANRMLNATQRRWGFLWRPYHEGIDKVSDFFTRRNNIVLATFIHFVRKMAGEHSNRLLFLLTSVLWHASKMSQYKEGGGGIMPGLYYVPPVYKEQNVLRLLRRKFSDFVNAYRVLQVKSTSLCLSTQSAVDLSAIPDDSVDYIFTDPPYAEKVQYGEANHLWEAWLGLDTNWRDQEIIINPALGRDEAFWRNQMELAVKECFRVLKPGRWMTLCYHDTSAGTWESLQDLVASAGFIPSQTLIAVFIDAKQKSPKQYTSAKTAQRDLIINFRKPRAGERRSSIVITGDEDRQTFREKAQTVIREFLGTVPGSTKDRIYDEVVSRLVRKGQMEAHDFDGLLREVADEVKQPVKKSLFEYEEPDLLGYNQVGRWHLKESQAGAEEAERATADSAGLRIHDFLAKTTAAKLEESEPKLSELQAEIAQRRTRLRAIDQGKSDEARGKLVREIRELTDKLEKLNSRRAEWEHQALDYSQIFEFYVAAVNSKPKATLHEILEDYCYQTDEGYWRPPLTEPEKQEKSSERQRAVRRKIQRFFNFVETGGTITESQRPDAHTLAEWIRHCRRTGLYAQGRLLYERGGLDLNALNEEAQVDVEEDYQVCAKRLERNLK